MKKFQLCVKSVTPDDMDTHSIWGEIHAEINGQCFPDDMWYDNASSVLHMWLGETIDYLTGKRKRWELPFMDGPYIIRMSEHLNKNILIAFITRDEKNDEKECNHIVVKQTDLIEELLHCVKVFLEACYKDAPNSTTMRFFKEIQHMCRMLDKMKVEDSSPVSSETDPIDPN